MCCLCTSPFFFTCLDALGTAVAIFSEATKLGRTIMCCSRQGLKVSYLKRNSWKTGCTMNLQSQLVSILHFPQACTVARQWPLQPCRLTRVCQLEPFKPRQTGHGLKLTQKTSWNTRWHVFVEGLANVLKILRLNNHCLCLCFIFQGLNSTSGRLASISFSKIREVKAKLAKLLALLISSLSLISLTRFVRSQMLQPGACLLTKHFPLKTRSVLQSRQTLSTAGLLCTVQVLNFTFLDVPSLLDLKSLLPVESKLHVRDSTAS